MSHAFYSSQQKFNMTNLKSPINDVVIIVYIACQTFRMSQIFVVLPLHTLVAGKDTLSIQNQQHYLICFLLNF